MSPWPANSDHVTKMPENMVLGRTMLVSAVFHAAIISCFLAWKVTADRRPAPEKVIAVELVGRELRQQKQDVLAQPIVNQRPQGEVVKAHRSARTAPASVVNAAPPVTVPLTVPREAVSPGEGEMAFAPPPAPVVAVKPGAAQPASPAVTGRAQADSGNLRAGDRADRDDIEARSRYRAQVRDLIEKYKEYPLFARKAGREGTCTVACSIGRDGSVRNIHVEKTSGHEILDRAALRAVSNAGRFPPLPREIGGDEVRVSVPISFSLYGR